MKKTMWKACCHLSGKIKDSDGVEKHPTLITDFSSDKDSLMSFVENLYSSGLIIGYRLLYSPDGDLNKFYFSNEVKYIPDGSIVFSI